MLDLVDDEAAGVEGLCPVRRGNNHDHGRLFDLESADPMHRLGVIESEAFHGVLDNAAAFLLRDRRMSLIFQAEDPAAFVVIANGPFEDDHRSCMRMTGGLAVGRVRMRGRGLMTPRLASGEGW